MSSRRSSRVAPAPSDYGWLLDEIASLSDRLATLEAPSGESLAATTQRTQANIEELLTRRSYSAEGGIDVEVPFGTALPYSTPQAAAISFDLTEARRVRLHGSCYIGIVLASNGTGGLDPWGGAQLTLRITNNVTGNFLEVHNSVSAGAGYNAGQRALARRADRPFIEDYRVLQPGSFTLSLWVEIYKMDGTGGSITLSAATTSVQIMEKDG